MRGKATPGKSLFHYFSLWYGCLLPSASQDLNMFTSPSAPSVITIQTLLFKPPIPILQQKRLFLFYIHVKPNKEPQAIRWEASQPFPSHSRLHTHLTLKSRGVKDMLPAGAGPENLVHAPLPPSPLHLWTSHLYP